MRTYTIILINCDCGSDVIAVLSNRPNKWIFGPRCRGCHRILGLMQWMADGSIMASDDLEAVRLYWERRRKRYEQKLIGEKV